MQYEFGSAHAAYQDVPEVVNTVHDNSSQVDLDIEDGMLIELGLHPVTCARLRGRGAENTCDTIHYLLVVTHTSICHEEEEEDAISPSFFSPLSAAAAAPAALPKPANLPLVHAHKKLNPPMRPCTSQISPQQNTFSNP